MSTHEFEESTLGFEESTLEEESTHMDNVQSRIKVSTHVVKVLTHEYSVQKYRKCWHLTLKCRHMWIVVKLLKTDDQVSTHVVKVLTHILEVSTHEKKCRHLTARFLNTVFWNNIKCNPTTTNSWNSIQDIIYKPPKPLWTRYPSLQHLFDHQSASKSTFLDKFFLSLRVDIYCVISFLFTLVKEFVLIL